MLRFPATLVACFLLCSCIWDSLSGDLDYLVLDDSAYPYAGIPRLVIETRDFRQIQDRETKIPARLQIYGKSGPESEILDLTVRGRGNSSFTGMPKWSIKLKFEEKQKLLGLPKDKEWALIANSADKTLLKNFITYKLASRLNDEYSPRGKFVELYLNRKYMGVYLLVETVKVSKNRVNIVENDFSYLLELNATEHPEDVHFYSLNANKFTFKYPKEPSDSSIKVITRRINAWENYLNNETKKEPISSWLDEEDFIRYYWIQELSKNYDGAFRRSIFITWEQGGLIKMGPVWDFDVAYGNWDIDTLQHPFGWYVRNSDWNRQLLQDSAFKAKTIDYWNSHKTFFETLPDSINKYAAILSPATKNEFRRWPVLENTENWTYKESYKSYREAVDSLNSWIVQRIRWIDQNLK